MALRRVLGNWRLLASVGVGAVIAAALLSSTAIYADAIRDLGLDFALRQERAATLDVEIVQTTFPVDRRQYQRSRDRVDVAPAEALAGASAGQVRMGTSATLFPTAPGETVSERADRPRAFLRFRSELESHLRVVEGAFPEARAEAAAGPLPVAVGLATATRNEIAVGRRFDLHPFWDEQAAPLVAEVVAIIDAVEPLERYWGATVPADTVIDRRTASWETLALIVPETTFFGALPELAHGVSADFSTRYVVDLDALNARDAVPVAAALGGLEQRLSASEERLHLTTALVEVLETFDEKLFFTRLPLLVLLLQVGGIAAYYLVMVSTMLVERQVEELALLRSRGATTAQLLTQYALEGLLLAALALAAGPPLAAAAIAALGATPAFAALSGGGPLEVHVSTLAYLLAGGGALLAFVALMLPAWRATRSTVVEFKRAAARPPPTPPFLRYYLDVVLVVVSALVFWQLSRQDELFTESLFGEVQADPFLLLTPSVFLLTVGLLFLRLFPLALRLVAWLVGHTGSVAMLVGMRSLVRNPGHYTRLILLLMFAAGVGMFGASFSATLDRSYSDRAAYAVGADVRAADLRALTGLGEGAFRAAVSAVPATVVSPVARVNGQLLHEGRSVDIELLGVEPATFREVGFFRDDFSEQSLDEIAGTLAANGTILGGVPVPAGARQIGAWVKALDIRGPVRVVVTLRDSSGRYVNAELGELLPSDPAGGEWRFLSRDLLTVAPRSGPLRGVPPTPPLTLQGFFLQPRGNIARAQGAVLLGPVLATATTPDSAADGAPPSRDLAFPAAVAVHDFSTIKGFELIEDLRPSTAGDRAAASVDAPAGFAGSTRLEWLPHASRRQPELRGLRQHTDGEPMAFYLLARTAAELGLATGDQLTVRLGQRYTAAVLAGVFEFFPTVEVGALREAPAVVDLSRLLAVANASPPARPAVPEEVWYAAADPLALRLALEGGRLDAQLLMDVETEQVRQQQDPLIAAGWQGILAIAFGAVLLLSAIGFLVYSHLTAQQRALEFAILRTLGVSRWQVFSLVAFEHVFVIVAGMGLGTVVGLQVGRLMMDFLGTDERGQDVLPPFVLGVSWPAVFVSWGVLGAVFILTVGLVVLRYWRLAVHRALRIGDV